jgi:hypothetical protein
LKIPARREECSLTENASSPFHAEPEYFEHKGLYGRIKEDVPQGDYTLPIGKARVVREGKSPSLISYGAMVYVALEAAEALEKYGVSVEVVNLRTLLPFDKEAVLATVRKTPRVILLHEDTLTGGLGGGLAARISGHAFKYRDSPVARIAAADSTVPFRTPVDEAFLPNRDKVIEKARWLCAYSAPGVSRRPSPSNEMVCHRPPRYRLKRIVSRLNPARKVCRRTSTSPRRISCSIRSTSQAGGKSQPPFTSRS